MVKVGVIESVTKNRGSCILDVFNYNKEIATIGFQYPWCLENNPRIGDFLIRKGSPDSLVKNDSDNFAVITPNAYDIMTKKGLNDA